MTNIKLPAWLAEPLHHWHDGQDDPVYKAGAMAQAGLPCPEDVVIQAMDILESFQENAHMKYERVMTERQWQTGPDLDERLAECNREIDELTDLRRGLQAAMSKAGEQ